MSDHHDHRRDDHRDRCRGHFRGHYRGHYCGHHRDCRHPFDFSVVSSEDFLCYNIEQASHHE